MPRNTALSLGSKDVLTEHVVTIEGSVPSATISGDGLSIQTATQKITAIPYYVWCNRGQNQMQVWLPVKMKEVKLNN